ncbi:SET domain-containing protein [Polychaeton citri CBS 116435]|uniref:Histone-lysine N-methyltransferase SET5 n=1 Tax=Polychaeton citri CBS 116435 TaxID=1314669 RepID=A0A9P4UPA7_9PEZI|nr:SET domain-containing protein [Polychaeton citri CBS 116435]
MGEEKFGIQRPVDVLPNQELNLSRTVKYFPYPDSIEVRTTDDRGCGVFALQTITKGTILFREAPLIRVVTSSAADFYLWPELEKLTAVELDNYSKLSFHMGKVSAATFHNLRTRNQRNLKLKGNALHDQVEADARLFAIWKTNCISIDINDSALDGESGLFPFFSRINHSCDPNSDGHLDDCTKELNMFTTRDIQAGEEITHTYINLAKYKTKRQRAKQLKNWCFVCTCERCRVE